MFSLRGLRLGNRCCTARSWRFDRKQQHWRDRLKLQRQSHLCYTILSRDEGIEEDVSHHAGKAPRGPPAAVSPFTFERKRLSHLRCAAVASSHCIALCWKHTVGLCRHAELVKIMGPIDGLNAAVAQFEKQAYDQSEGNNVRTKRAFPSAWLLVGSIPVCACAAPHLSRCLQQFPLSADTSTQLHGDIQTREPD